MSLLLVNPPPSNHLSQHHTSRWSRNCPMLGRSRIPRKIWKQFLAVSYGPNVGICSLGIQSYSQMMIRVSNHLLSKAFRFHYHSQKVIGSPGVVMLPPVTTANEGLVWDSLWSPEPQNQGSHVGKVSHRTLWKLLRFPMVSLNILNFGHFP